MGSLVVTRYSVEYGGQKQTEKHMYREKARLSLNRKYQCAQNPCGWRELSICWAWVYTDRESTITADEKHRRAASWKLRLLRSDSLRINTVVYIGVATGARAASWFPLFIFFQFTLELHAQSLSVTLCSYLSKHFTVCNSNCCSLEVAT